MTIIGLFATAALVVQAAPPQQAPAQTGTGVIHGRVLRAGGTEGIEDATLTLNRGAAPGGPPAGGALAIAAGRGGSAASNRVGTAVSDKDGNFEFRDLPPGRYTVVAQRRGFGGPRINAPDPSAGVNVLNGQTADAVISMTPSGVVRGRVRDATGQFASNVQVDALVVGYRGGLPYLMPATSRASDDRGEYRLYGLPPGDYYIAVTPRPPSAIASFAGGARSVRTFYPGATDIARAMPVTIHGGEDLTNFDVQIQMPQGYKVSGQVSTTVAPVAPPPSAQGAFAVIQQNQNNLIQLFLVSREMNDPHDGREVGIAVPVSAGSVASFELPNVLPGSYDLLAGINFNSETPSIARTVIDVRSQDISGLVLTIKPGVTLKGNITLDGKGIQDRVLVHLDPADTLRRINAVLPSRMDADGAFSIPGVPDGRFRLSVAVLNPDLYVEDIKQGGVSIYDKGFEVRGSAPEPIQVTVKAGTASLTGTLQDSSGKPLGRGAVALVPATRRDNPGLYRVSSADATGAFTIREIPPGDYKIFSWDYMPEGAAYNAAFLEKYEERGLPITVGMGARLTLRVTAIPR